MSKKEKGGPGDPFGKIYYGRLDGVLYKLVYVAEVKVEGLEESTRILARAADGTGPRDRLVALTGGNERDANKEPGRGYVVLLAMRNLRSLRRRPETLAREDENPQDWGPEVAPRLDALRKLLRDEDSWPMDPLRPEEFYFSDDGPATEEGKPSRPRRRLEIIDASPEAETGRTAMRGDSLSWGPPSREEGPDPFAMRNERPPAGAAGPGLFGNVEVSAEEMEELMAMVRERLPRAPRVGRGRAAGERARGAEPSRAAARDGRARGDRSAESSEAESEDRGRRSRRDRERRDRDRDRDGGRGRERRRGSPPSSPSGSSGSDASSRSESNRSGRGARRRAGHGTRKIRSYEKLKKRFERRPARRWEFLEDAADEAGLGHAANKVELLTTRSTKLGKSKATAYLAALVARTGAAAAAGDGKKASGLAAATLGYLDTLYMLGDPELAWRTTLNADPLVVAEGPQLQDTLSVPTTGKAGAKAATGFAQRLTFSTLIDAEILETTLEAGKQWQAWGALARGSA